MSKSADNNKQTEESCSELGRSIKNKQTCQKVLTINKQAEDAE
jgi:hypothetical protein